MRHPSTPGDRLRWIGELLAQEGRYGLVTALSRASGVSRPTLYAWRERGRAALASVVGRVPTPAPGPTPTRERAILTLLVEGHASQRGIQVCLREALGWRLSQETIGAIIREAGERALAWFAAHAPAQPCGLALDELYGNDRHGAYLSAVATHGGAVWAVAGPVPVDAESWTVLLWEYQARGGRLGGTVYDGGNAVAAACAAVDPTGVHGRDPWHVLARCAKVQGRLDRQATAAADRLATLEHYEAATAAGQRPKGRVPTTTATTQAAGLARAVQIAADVSFLTGEVRRLLAVVVIEQGRLLDAATRRAELATVLALLAEVRASAPEPQRAELAGLSAHLAQALDGLLAFATALDPVQRDMAVVLGADAVALVAWAWRHRHALGPEAASLLAGLPTSWRQPARVLLAAWDGAAHASSLAEAWHARLRPHVAVHRTLAPGLLALLAVCHNHHIFARGVHRGQSPLMLSGVVDPPPDGLTALGYPPGPSVTPPLLLPAPRQEAAAA